jgi:glycolate oxidase iron-sulfur subunit
VQTAFTLEQLAQPEIAEADGILKTCVHYGFCTATCPTYVLFRDENDSPRGRIDLIRAMLEKGGTPAAKTVHHLDRCLSCLSCVTTCAVKVDYAHLIDIARAHIETNYRRPLGERLLRRMIAELLPYPWRFSVALRLARLASPLASVLPTRLRNLIDLASGWPVTGEILRPGISPAEGNRKMRVALLPSCAQQALDKNINAATIRLLRRHGCEVVVAAGVGCCGAVPLHMGHEAQGKALARANIAAWSAQLRNGLDAIVINASGCGTTVKDYAHLVGGEDARRISGLTRDVTELLAELGLSRGGGEPYRVAYHDACTATRSTRNRSATQASGAGRLQCARSAGTAFLLRLRRHLQSFAAGHRRGAGPTQGCAYRQRRSRHYCCRESRLHGAGRAVRKIASRPHRRAVGLGDWGTDAKGIAW